MPTMYEPPYYHSSSHPGSSSAEALWTSSPGETEYQAYRAAAQRGTGYSNPSHPHRSLTSSGYSEYISVYEQYESGKVRGNPREEYYIQAQHDQRYPPYLRPQHPPYLDRSPSGHRGAGGTHNELFLDPIEPLPLHVEDTSEYDLYESQNELTTHPSSLTASILRTASEPSPRRLSDGSIASVDFGKLNAQIHDPGEPSPATGSSSIDEHEATTEKDAQDEDKRKRGLCDAFKTPVDELEDLESHAGPGCRERRKRSIKLKALKRCFRKFGSWW
ncbi:hypothetical protein K491DRAFT_746120 [Lophiostoma macrostomum CBS 122681]|uniref:Uncharacterized protein n=1 Tax=Lophiostoma macrostomum CBS 122681 TaxID=1314788 RepID=A0A6A6T9D1_9PLEO|nr:hypothetical protein K491DRAFT_746120 [Lophiostoma macrostomum CBS 122681]